MKSEDIIKVENLKNNSDVFRIRWNMTYICNYSCDFCIQGDKQAHINKCKGESIETRTKICDNLIKFIETKLNGKYKYIRIFLIGGEVTILKDFYDIVKKIVECKFNGGIRINITTNLSTDDEILKKLSVLFNKVYEFPRILDVAASYYKDYTTEDEFMKKVSILSKKTYNKNTVIAKSKKKLYNLCTKIFRKLTLKEELLIKTFGKLDSIFVNISYPLCSDEDYNSYLKFINKYKNKVNRIDFIIIRDYKTSISENLKGKLENKDEKKRIKVTFKDGQIKYFYNGSQIGIVLEDELNFKSKGYLCDSGINNINISNIGKVSRCSGCKEKTIIGDLKEGNFEIPKDKLICPAERCVCSYYGVIEKNNE